MAIIKGNQNTTLLLNYLKSSSKQYPCLNKEQEREMINLYRHDRDKLNKLLFMHNIRIVFSQAKKYMSKVNDFDTLVQDGMLGLAEAARRFDLDRDVKFCTYCMPWVRKYLLLHFYGKQIELDKLTTSLNAPSPMAEPGDTSSDASFENFISSYIDPSYAQPKTIESEISSIEQEEICEDLYAKVEQDTSLSAVDKAVFIEMFKNREKTRDLAEKYNIQMEDVSEIKHRVLSKLRGILKNDFKINSYNEIGA